MTKAEDTLQGIDLIKQKKDMEAFFRELATESGKVSYGEDNVRTNLEINAVNVLLLSEDLRSERVTVKCSVCGHENKWTRKWKPREAVPAGRKICQNVVLHLKSRMSLISLVNSQNSLIKAIQGLLSYQRIST